MVNDVPEHLNLVFSALSDPTRRAILERLARGEASVMELAEPFDTMSLPAISKHLRVLEDAGLITREREGRTHHMRLSATAMDDAAEWISTVRRFWDEQFDNLTDFLNTPSEDEPTDE